MPLNINIGPFGKSINFANKFVSNISSFAMFQNLLNELVELEKIMNCETNDEQEKKMAEILYVQLEEQLNLMILHPGRIKNDESRKTKTNSLSST